MYKGTNTQDLVVTVIQSQGSDYIHKVFNLCWYNLLHHQSPLTELLQ